MNRQQRRLLGLHAARTRGPVESPVQAAIRRAQKIDPAKVEEQMALCRQHLHALQQLVCPHWLVHWRSLADVVNMAETLAGMRIGSGPDAEALLAEANQALAAVARREKETGAGRLTADEADCMAWTIRLHHVQMSNCSHGEYERAFDKTAERIRQALAGNASPATIVLGGDFGQPASERSDALQQQEPTPTWEAAQC